MHTHRDRTCRMAGPYTERERETRERHPTHLEDGGALLADVVHHGAARLEGVGHVLPVHLDARDAVVLGGGWVVGVLVGVVGRVGGCVGVA